MSAIGPETSSNFSLLFVFSSNILIAERTSVTVELEKYLIPSPLFSSKRTLRSRTFNVEVVAVVVIVTVVDVWLFSGRLGENEKKNSRAIPKTTVPKSISVIVKTLLEDFLGINKPYKFLNYILSLILIKGVDLMEMPEWIKRVQENIAKSDIKQMFADEALVMGAVKVGKTPDGKVKKEGNVRIVFVDMTTAQPLAKIVLSISTAKGLINALSEQLKRLEKDLESKDVGKKSSEEPSLTYIG